MADTAVAHVDEPLHSAPDLPMLLRWINALEETTAGRLMLTNLLHAFRTARLPTPTLRSLMVEFARTWVASIGRRPDSVVEYVADKAPTKYVCQPPTIAPGCGCSRIVDDVTFVTHNIDHRELPYEFVDYVPAELLDQIERGIPAELLGDETNTLRGSRPLAWVTHSAVIASLRQQHSDPDELATAVRDRLGLAHYWKDHRLIEIEYPSEMVDALAIVAPTFIDGGAGVLFRARTAPDGWGRAVDLETHDDGLPEAVHAPVRLTASFRVRRIGRVLRGSDFTHVKVIERAEHPWSSMPSDLLAFLGEQCAQQVFPEP